MEKIEMWMARDRSGILRIYDNEPKVDKRKQEIISIGAYYEIDSNSFPQITFDNSPKKIYVEVL